LHCICIADISIVFSYPLANPAILLNDDL